MAYCTVDDIKLAFGLTPVPAEFSNSSGYPEVTYTGNSLVIEEVSDTTISDQIDLESDYVLMMSKYDDDDTPAILKKITIALVVFYFWSRMQSTDIPKHVVESYNRSMTQLEKIGSGEININPQSSETEDFEIKYSVNTRYFGTRL